jgi:hypothetical protein
MLVAFATILVGSVLATRPTRRVRSGEPAGDAPLDRERIRAIGADAAS